MDIRELFQDCVLVILLLSIHRGNCSIDEDYEDSPSTGRCPWIRNKLKNGRVRYRYKGRVAKFLCDSGYELAGKRSSTCVRGQWSNPVPVCVARGCNRVPSIANGRVTEMYRGALLVYDCNPGYTLTGDSSIHCDGRRWNASPPACGVSPDIVPDTRCDFENPFLCGWTHDPTHDFDWRRNQLTTPSGHVGTGPSHDHTFGKNKAGYYLYIEASSPRKTNDTARIFSPVYPGDESGGCFIFWYHMYGATTGGIRVYFKPESHVFGELSPKWEKFGDQGNQWFRGNITVPPVNEKFQIVIEGIRGNSYVGDSAIDDVQLTKHDCKIMENATETPTEDTDANSCRGRCRVSDASASCDCKEICVAAGSCCSDFFSLCADGNETIEQHTYEGDLSDYYGKTSSPLTVTATLASVTPTEMQTLPTLLNFSSQSISQYSTASSLSTAFPITISTQTVTPEAVPPSSSSKSVDLTTDTSSSTAPTFVTKPSTIEIITRVIPISATSNTSASTLTTVPTTEESSMEPKIALNTTLKTTTKAMTSASAIPLKTSSNTKTTVSTSTSSTSTRSTTEETTNTPLTTQTMTLRITQPTTITTTTNISTTTTPELKTITPSSPSSVSTSTTVTTITTNTVPASVTEPESTSSSPLTNTASTSVSKSSTSTSTTTRRYNLRPRYSLRPTSTTTTTAKYSTASNYFSTPKDSTLDLGTTSTPSNTEKSTISSVIYSSPQPRRWFNVTAISTSTVSITIKTSPSTATPVTSTSVRYKLETSKYSYRMPNPTSTVQSSSLSTTSDSHEIIASRTESSKSSSSSEVTIGVAVFATICIAGGVVFGIRRLRRKRLSKLADDSEMRFLPENDYMEYSDASALDRILIK